MVFVYYVIRWYFVVSEYHSSLFQVIYVFVRNEGLCFVYTVICSLVHVGCFYL